jgi:AcrR family transcriptional regulator
MKAKKTLTFFDLGKPPRLRGREPVPRSPRQQRSLRRRQSLLRAAQCLFARDGFEAASVARIAARALVPAGTFYQHFASKKQLLIVLMNAFMGRLAKLNLAPSGNGDSRDQMQKFLTAAFRSDSRHFGVVRAWREASFADPELARMEKRIGAWTQARVLHLLESMAQSRSGKRPQNLQAFARMMDRHFWMLLARGTEMSRADQDAEVRLLTDVIYRFMRHSAA